jgi:hypothetical protein
VSSRSVQIIGGSDRQHAHVTDANRLKVESVITDGTTEAAVDSLSDALLIMDSVHANIHRGIFYTASYYNSAVGSGSSAYLSIVVTTPMHARMSAAVSADFVGRLYTGATLNATPGGTILTAFNRNPFSSNVSDAVLRGEPTIDSLGTERVVQFIPGGKGGNAVGGSDQTFEEFILDTGTHVVRLQNEAHGTQKCSFQVDFYHPSQA